MANTSQFKPEYASGTTNLNIEGTGQHDMIAMLFNESNGKEARIGTYRIDFESGTSTPLSYDINGAFDAVDGLRKATATSTSAQPPQSQTQPTQTSAQPVTPPDQTAAAPQE